MESIKKMINFTDQKFSKISNYPVNFTGLIKINKILSSYHDEIKIEVSVYNLNKRDNENLISLYNNGKIENNDEITNNSKLILNRIEIHYWKKINNEWLKNDINLILIN